MPDSNKKFHDVLYKRGYLITDKKVEKPCREWNEINVGNFFISYDSLNEVIVCEKQSTWVVILGSIIDLENHTMDKREIGHRILEYLDCSEDRFYDYLDILSGRYLIMYHDGFYTKILSDATGMRSIVYSTSQTIISSHINIVKNLTNDGKSPLIKNEWAKKYGGYHIPGHYTPYKNTFLLTPNTFFNIETKEVKRFFPRKPLEIRQPKEVARFVSDMVKKQLKLLSDVKENFLFSLTAGIDSRATLSLTKEFVNKMQYFTYYKISQKYPNGVKSLEIDRKVVGDIANNLNLKHTFVPLEEDNNNDEYYEFINIMKNNTIRSHSFRLAKFYYDKLPHETLHIRSNILEIGRFFYRNKLMLPKELDINALLLCYSPKAENDQEILHLLDNYCRVVEMKNIYNYDPYDIFYWEYRMGAWHSQLLLESDIAHDTFIPFNSRKILELLLSVNDAAKKNNTVFNEIINNNWPILNYWGINTLEKPIDKLDKQIDEYGLDLKNIKLKSGSMYNDLSKIDYKVKNIGRKAKFFINKNAPSKGDFLEASIPINAPVTSYMHCILHIRTPYENKKNTGRLKYQVLLNESVILEEDIALWKESNLINLHFKALMSKTKLTIRILAIKDCEEWNWGRAGTVIIESIIIRKSDNKSETVTATSPHSKIIS